MNSWITMSKVLDVLEHHCIYTNAPLATNATPFRKKQEAKFQKYEGNTELIPENYMERFNEMIAKIKEFYDSDSLFKHARRGFWCDIVFVKLGLVNNNLIIYEVWTRPCAQSCGLYRYLLWNIGKYAVEKKFETITLDSCTPENVEILDRMGGFTDPTEGTPQRSSPNIFITLENLKTYTMDKEKWNIPSSFPPASLLNDQAFVNRFVDKTEDTFTY